MNGRTLGDGATAAIIFALGFGVSLCGDATHVASGTTVYEWDGVPAIWRSAIWFPFLVGGAVLERPGRASASPPSRSAGGPASTRSSAPRSCSRCTG